MIRTSPRCEAGGGGHSPPQSCTHHTRTGYPQLSDPAAQGLTSAEPDNQASECKTVVPLFPDTADVHALQLPAPGVTRILAMFPVRIQPRRLGGPKPESAYVKPKSV